MVLDDDSLLDSIRELFEAADPMPPDLLERIKFMVALRQLDAEVAWLVTAEAEAGLAARGTEESRTITFDSDSLTIMIRIDSGPGESIRVDGWLAPPQCRRVEMRMGDASIAVMADVAAGSSSTTCRAGPPASSSTRLRTARSALRAPLRRGRPESVITPALVLLGGG